MDDITNFTEKSDKELIADFESGVRGKDWKIGLLRELELRSPNIFKKRTDLQQAFDEVIRTQNEKIRPLFDGMANSLRNAFSGLPELPQVVSPELTELLNELGESKSERIRALNSFRKLVGEQAIIQNQNISDMNFEEPIVQKSFKNVSHSLLQEIASHSKKTSQNTAKGLFEKIGMTIGVLTFAVACASLVIQILKG